MFSLLVEKARKGDLNEVRNIVQKNANINDKTEAFLHSAYDGHLDVVKFLIGKGANIHARSELHSFGVPTMIVLTL